LRVSASGPSGTGGFVGEDRPSATKVAFAIRSGSGSSGGKLGYGDVRESVQVTYKIFDELYNSLFKIS
jgi:hypothetical protein